MRWKLRSLILCCLWLMAASGEAWAVKASGGITVSPTSFTADTGATGTIQICIRDALGSPISYVDFNWTNYSAGTVLIGGSTASPLGTSTDSTGCVSTTISAAGVAPNQATDYVTFYLASGPYRTFPPAQLNLSASWTLQATPTSIFGNGTTALVLTLLSSSLTPQPNIFIQEACTASGGMFYSISPSAVQTDTSGKATFSLTPSGAVVFNATPGSVTCTFSTPSYPSAVAPATVVAQGLDACKLNYLPQPPQCGDPAP